MQCDVANIAGPCGGPTQYDPLKPQGQIFQTPCRDNPAKILFGKIFQNSIAHQVLQK